MNAPNQVFADAATDWAAGKIWTDYGELTAVPPELAAATFGRLDKYVAANGNNAPRSYLPRVVGLSGAAGSGKSTVADYLVSAMDYERIKFAGPLKAMLAELLRFQGVHPRETDAYIEGALKEEVTAMIGFHSPRYAMQTLGAQWGRDCMGEGFWVRLWAGRAAKFPLVVADDCRYPNEAAEIRHMGGRIIKMIGRGGIAGNHSSEADIGICDAVIENTGTIDALLEKVDNQLQEWAA